MECIPQSTARRQLLKAYLASDHVTAATGKTLAVEISKNGGAFANPHVGAINATEIAAGWYYVDLDATDTNTLGPLAVRATAAGVDDVEILLSVVDPAVTLSGVACQQIAREAHGCRGAVWHVAVGGNDANDGLSWATAKESPKNAIEAASAGDLVLLGAGTFALGNNGIVVPDDVSLCGAGAGRTIVTSELTFGTALVPIVRPGSRSTIRRLTIRGLSDLTNLQCALGAAFTQSPFVDAVVSDCELTANDHAVACQAEGTTVRIERCVLRAEQDAAIYSAANDASIDVVDSRIFCVSPLSSACIAGGAAATSGGRILLSRSAVDAQGYGAYDMYGLWARDGSEVLVYDCAIRVYATDGAAMSLVQEDSGRLVVCGCQYDRATTQGAIVDVARIRTDDEGNARLGELGDEERRAIADALLDRADGIEAGTTPRQAVRIIAAILAGKVTGAGSGTERFRALDGVTPRVEVTADAAGNRSNVTYTPG